MTIITPQTGWKPVPGYETFYEIHPTGLVRSLRKKTFGHILSKHICLGYVTVRLTKSNGKGSTQNLHRLLALTFIPNPLGKPYVNHMNGFKLDNCLENLEWVTHQENVKHGYKIRQTSFTKRPVWNWVTNTVHASMAEAARAYNINYHSLKLMLYGTTKNTTRLRLLK